MNIVQTVANTYHARKSNKAAEFRDIGEGNAIITLTDGRRFFVEPQQDGTFEVNQIGVVGCGYGYTVEEAVADLEQ